MTQAAREENCRHCYPREAPETRGDEQAISDAIMRAWNAVHPPENLIIFNKGLYRWVFKITTQRNADGSMPPRLCSPVLTNGYCYLSDLRGPNGEPVYLEE